MTILCASCQVATNQGSVWSWDQLVFALVTGVVATVLVEVWRSLRLWLHFGKYSGTYVRYDIDEYHLPIDDPDNAARVNMEQECCFQLIKVKYMGNGEFETIAQYWPQDPKAFGQIDFSGSRWIGRGTYRYESGEGFGAYTMYLHKDRPDQVRMVYEGKMPHNRVNGYDKWVKLSSATQELFPTHLQGLFVERIAALRARGIT